MKTKQKPLWQIAVEISGDMLYPHEAKLRNENATLRKAGNEMHRRLQVDGIGAACRANWRKLVEEGK